MTRSRQPKKSKNQPHSGRIARFGIPGYSSRPLPSCRAARSRFQESAFSRRFIFVNAQPLPMRENREVVKNQIVTGWRRFDLSRTIPTPNPNYPRTGNDVMKGDKQSLRWEGSSELVAEMLNAAASFAWLRFVLLELAVKSSFPDPKQARGD